MKNLLSVATAVPTFILAVGVLITGLSGTPAYAGKRVVTTNYPATSCKPTRSSTPNLHAMFPSVREGVYANGGVENRSSLRDIKLVCAFDRKLNNSVSEVAMFFEDNHPLHDVACTISLVDPYGKLVRKIFLTSTPAHIRTENLGKKDFRKRLGPGQGEDELYYRYTGNCFIPKRVKGKPASKLYGITIVEREK